MPLGSRHTRPSTINIWPGFVDALTQLLMVIIFILLVFTVGQFYLADALSGRNAQLKKLQHQVDNLADLLSLERTTNVQLREKAAAAATQLEATLAQRKALSAKVEALTSKEQTAEQALTTEQQISSKAAAQVALLNQQIAALRQQLSQLATALDVSRAKVKQQQVQIVNLGKKLNLALASKVQELARYRSEFFGRLRQILGNRPDIRIVGDRFVFQAEVLFAPGKADLSDKAKQELVPVATALKQIAAEIPLDIHWVLQVNGYTDRRPIHTAQFPSNWELSAARAISVVRFFMAHGISANRLSAAGYADTHPINPANTPAAYRANRRIELKLTSVQ